MSNNCYNWGGFPVVEKSRLSIGFFDAIMNKHCHKLDSDEHIVLISNKNRVNTKMLNY